MNTGKTLFAQIMDFLPWKTFHRIVARHGGDKGVRTLTCAEQFRAMAFAQLTYRESLRDIEACLQAQRMGFDVRWRVDPIFNPPGWEALYDEFFREAVGMGIRRAK